jgi:DNA-binding response OmpR family regulator
MEENKKKILVVEDEKFAREILKFSLTNEGYEVSVANDGLEGVNKASAKNYDLIIMDVMMPNLDGYEACRRLKANEKTKAIPIILFTGRAQKKDVLNGLQAGADDYMIKPYKMQELLHKITKFIGPIPSVSPDQAADTNNSEPVEGDETNKEGIETPEAEKND